MICIIPGNGRTEASEVQASAWVARSSVVGAEGELVAGGAGAGPGGAEPAGGRAAISKRYARGGEVSRRSRVASR